MPLESFVMISSCRIQNHVFTISLRIVLHWLSVMIRKPNSGTSQYHTRWHFLGYSFSEMIHILNLILPCILLADKILTLRTAWLLQHMLHFHSFWRKNLMLLNGRGAFKCAGHCRTFFFPLWLSQRLPKCGCWERLLLKVKFFSSLKSVSCQQNSNKWPFEWQYLCKLSIILCLLGLEV